MFEAIYWRKIKIILDLYSTEFILLDGLIKKGDR